MLMMPSITGPIKINTVASAGTVDFSDTLETSPKSTLKTFTGQGSTSTGDLHGIFKGVNLTNSSDPNLEDASNSTNN